MGEITVLLKAVNNADVDAVNSLYKLLYRDLQTIARSRLNRSGTLTVMDTVGLVNESYMKLLKVGEIDIPSKGHFLAYASSVMRSIVVDLARQRATERAGGALTHVELNTSIADSIPVADDDVIRIHDALEVLASIDPRLVQVVEMRYFAGLSEAETATSLGISDRTVRRDWEKARAILHCTLKAE